MAVNAKALQLSVSLLVDYLLFKPNPMIQKIPAKLSRIFQYLLRSPDSIHPKLYILKVIKIASKIRIVSHANV